MRYKNLIAARQKRYEETKHMIKNKATLNELNIFDIAEELKEISTTLALIMDKLDNK